MIADHFDGDILGSRAEAATASASARFGRGRRRSDNLESDAARFSCSEPAHRQIAEHQAVAGRRVLVIERAFHFEPLERDSRHTVLLSERVDILFLTAIDAGSEQAHGIGLDGLVRAEENFHAR